MTYNDPINGSTPPEVLQLALSGKLAAAAGGESTISQEDAIPDVLAVYAPELTQEGSEQPQATQESQNAAPLPETASEAPAAAPKAAASK